jgi:hypothetical protein
MSRVVLQSPPFFFISDCRDDSPFGNAAVRPWHRWHGTRAFVFICHQPFFSRASLSPYHEAGLQPAARELELVVYRPRVPTCECYRRFTRTSLRLRGAAGFCLRPRARNTLSKRPSVRLRVICPGAGAQPSKGARCVPMSSFKPPARGATAEPPGSRRSDPEPHVGLCRPSARSSAATLGRFVFTNLHSLAVALRPRDTEAGPTKRARRGVLDWAGRKAWVATSAGLAFPPKPRQPRRSFSLRSAAATRSNWWPCDPPQRPNSDREPSTSSLCASGGAVLANRQECRHRIQSRSVSIGSWQRLQCIVVVVMRRAPLETIPSAT